MKSLNTGRHKRLTNLYLRYERVIHHTAFFKLRNEAEQWAGAMLSNNVVKRIAPIDDGFILTWVTKDVKYG